MGMSTSLIGFVSPDNEDYKKHAAVLRACLDANIEELPKETAEFFNNAWPEEYLLEEKLKITIPYRTYDEDMQEGFEIILSEIPAEVHKIRFVTNF